MVEWMASSMPCLSCSPRCTDGSGSSGKSRRRSAITSDLELLDRLQQTSDFGVASLPYHELKSHIEVEVRAYTGGRTDWRKREWFTIIFAALLGALCGYGAYRANAVGWWLALIAWIPAGVFALTALVALVSPPDSDKKAEGESGASVSQA
jgi:hypothetical protein